MVFQPLPQRAGCSDDGARRLEGSNDAEVGGLRRLTDASSSLTKTGTPQVGLGGLVELVEEEGGLLSPPIDAAAPKGFTLLTTVLTDEGEAPLTGCCPDVSDAG